MNLAQIRIAVRDILTAGGGTNTTINADSFWNDSEINLAINQAQAEMYKIIRRARADFFTRILRSTDSPLVIKNQLYAPAVLRWVAQQGNYVLPPDFVRMKLITDLDTVDRVRLVGSDIAKNEFRILMNSAGGEASREFLYDILGVRTLIIRPIPPMARDFEFIYERSLANLQDFTAGTVSVIQDNNTATFSASAMVDKKFSVGDELIVGTTTPNPNEYYPVIKSIDSSTQVTLERVYLGASISDSPYIVSNVSEIPQQHHFMLVCLAASYCFNKGTNPSADAAAIWKNEFNGMVPSLVNDLESRQGSDFETVQAYLEEDYD
jgi:hypothetical protein